MKLKPCPFCGNEIELQHDKKRHAIRCNNCYSFGGKGADEDNASVMWNMRAYHPNKKQRKNLRR